MPHCQKQTRRISTLRRLIVVGKKRVTIRSWPSAASRFTRSGVGTFSDTRRPVSVRSMRSTKASRAAPAFDLRSRDRKGNGPPVNRLPEKDRAQWPPAFAKCYPGLGTVLMTARAAVNTFKTIQFLSVEKPKDPWQKPEFVANVLPLARTLLEESSISTSCLAIYRIAVLPT